MFELVFSGVSCFPVFFIWEPKEGDGSEIKLCSDCRALFWTGSSSEELAIVAPFCCSCTTELHVSFFSADLEPVRE